MSEQMPFTRRTLLAASDFFERAGTTAKFDLMVQRLELNQWVPYGDKLSVSKKGTSSMRNFSHGPARSSRHAKVK